MVFEQDGYNAPSIRFTVVVSLVFLEAFTPNFYGRNLRTSFCTRPLCTRATVFVLQKVQALGQIHL